jgi:hypothetical protein
MGGCAGDRLLELVSVAEKGPDIDSETGMVAHTPLRRV